MFRRPHSPALMLAILSLILIACRQEEPPPEVTLAGTVEVNPATTPADSGVTGDAGADPAADEPTTIPATPTPDEPLAALVNDQAITLADYEKELARYEQAQNELGLALDANGQNYRVTVLDALIETELIAQAAAARGLEVTDEMIEARMAELVEASGGTDNFSAWLQANQWTEPEFRQALRRELITEQMVEAVTADVPFTTEQVRARYLQVDDPALAQSLLDQIRAGADFAALAQRHSLDRVTGESGGDLGYFARGALLVPEVEAAAFALQPGEVSDVITGTTADGSQTTYYLVQLVERDPARPLTADMRFSLLRDVFEAWLAEQWAQADIVRFVDIGT
ncbi:MAG: SurA N-terminal domain-containing protein [Candidatus Promineifilaceae bacterium]|nr:SurA N-terminal domain-containing protein [Candidatus Promineifilaceae bacterium]